MVRRKNRPSQRRWPLNLADNADAKMQTLTEIFKNKTREMTGWGYNRMFETNLRRSSI